jgi:glutathione S-transferase
MRPDQPIPPFDPRPVTVTKPEICLSALAALMGEAPWLAGAEITLADLHAAPIVSVFRVAPEGANLLGQETRLRGWWERASARPSFLRTKVPPRHEPHSAEAV